MPSLINGYDDHLNKVPPSTSRIENTNPKKIIQKGILYLSNAFSKIASVSKLSNVTLKIIKLAQVVFGDEAFPTLNLMSMPLKAIKDITSTLKLPEKTRGLFILTKGSSGLHVAHKVVSYILSMLKAVKYFGFLGLIKLGEVAASVGKIPVIGLITKVPLGVAIHVLQFTTSVLGAVEDILDFLALNQKKDNTLKSLVKWEQRTQQLEEIIKAIKAQTQADRPSQVDPKEADGTKQAGDTPKSLEKPGSIVPNEKLNQSTSPQPPMVVQTITETSENSTPFATQEKASQTINPPSPVVVQAIPDIKFNDLTSVFSSLNQSKKLSDELSLNYLQGSSKLDQSSLGILTPSKTLAPEQNSITYQNPTSSSRSLDLTGSLIEDIIDRLGQSRSSNRDSNPVTAMTHVDDMIQSVTDLPSGLSDQNLPDQKVPDQKVPDLIDSLLGRSTLEDLTDHQDPSPALEVTRNIEERNTPNKHQSSATTTYPMDTSIQSIQLNTLTESVSNEVTVFAETPKSIIPDPTTQETYKGNVDQGRDLKITTEDDGIKTRSLLIRVSQNHRASKGLQERYRSKIQAASDQLKKLEMSKDAQTMIEPLKIKVEKWELVLKALQENQMDLIVQTKNLYYEKAQEKKNELKLVKQAKIQKTFSLVYRAAKIMIAVAAVFLFFTGIGSIPVLVSYFLLNILTYSFGIFKFFWQEKHSLRPELHQTYLTPPFKSYQRSLA